jgi:hypothetical protein
MGDRTERARLHRRARRLQSGGGAAFGRQLLLIFFTADRILGEQFACPHHLGPRIGQLRRGARRLRLGLGQSRAIRAWINLEQELVPADLAAFLKPDAGNHAGDARAHLHIVDGLEPAHIVVPVDNLPLQRIGGRDDSFLRRRRRRGVAAPGQSQGEGSGCKTDGPCHATSLLPQHAQFQYAAAIVTLVGRI